MFFEEIKEAGEGFNGKDLISIISPSFQQHQEHVYDTLRHEIQHSADKHRAKENTPALTKLKNLLKSGKKSQEANDIQEQIEAEKILRNYQTEYRAYYYQGSYFYDYQNQKEEEHGLGDQYNGEERQEYIFRHIYENYPEISTAWNSNLTLADGRKFQDAVLDYGRKGSYAFNKLNSILVDDFYQALHRIGQKKSRRNNIKTRK